MKGTVYSGIVHWPDHPQADIHGNLRLAIRTKSWPYVSDTLTRHGLSGRLTLWVESKSAVEQTATEGHYGELLACALPLAYLKPENYRPVVRVKKAGAAKSGGTAPSADLPQEAYRGR